MDSQTSQHTLFPSIRIYYNGESMSHTLTMTILQPTSNNRDSGDILGIARSHNRNKKPTYLSTWELSIMSNFCITCAWPQLQQTTSLLKHTDSQEVNISLGDLNYDRRITTFSFHQPTRRPKFKKLMGSILIQNIHTYKKFYK